MEAGPKRLAGLLVEAGVEYALIGGHAVNTWLEPRFTADVDVTLQADIGEMELVKAILEREGFSIGLEHGRELPSGPDFVRFVSRDGAQVFEIQAAKTELQRQVIGRAKTLANGVRVATAEDLILLKLIADRPKDQIDLDGLSRLPTIDWSYVEDVASDWELSARLAQLRAQAKR